VATHEPPTVHKAVSDIMVGRRLNDAEREAKGRSALVEAKIAEAIERNLAKAPSLSPSQIRRLSGLLRSGGQR